MSWLRRPERQPTDLPKSSLWVSIPPIRLPVVKRHGGLWSRTRAPVIGSSGRQRNPRVGSSVAGRRRPTECAERIATPER